MEEKLRRALDFIREKTQLVPQVALVLGSGLGEYGKQISLETEIPYGEIPGFPVSTVEGHQGKFLLGHIGTIPVVMMQGRVHYYEGYSMGDVVMPVRLMGLMGAKTLVLTNAAGGINESFRVGDLMLITDHISSFVPSPLIGENISSLGTRFPDMSRVYSSKLSEIALACARRLNIELKSGVYLQTTGPNYETPAEIRMYSALGASAVGMSTAVEAMAAAHMGVSVLGLSLITNPAAGISSVPLNHEEVQLVAKKAGDTLSALVKEIIAEVGKND